MTKLAPESLMQLRHELLRQRGLFWLIRRFLEYAVSVRGEKSFPILADPLWHVLLLRASRSSHNLLELECIGEFDSPRGRLPLNRQLAHHVQWWQELMPDMRIVGNRMYACTMFRSVTQQPLEDATTQFLFQVASEVTGFFPSGSSSHFLR